jgi:hypothetical protein
VNRTKALRSLCFWGTQTRRHLPQGCEMGAGRVRRIPWEESKVRLPLLMKSPIRGESVIRPNHRVPFSFEMVTTFGTSHGPKQPLIESGMRFNNPLARHSFLSHSTGTAGLPFAVFPQQQPWQTLTCPSTSRFVISGNFSIYLSSLDRHGFPIIRCRG